MDTFQNCYTMIQLFVGAKLIERKEVVRMKKALSEKALLQEAAFWDRLKKVTRENPGKTCHK